MKDKKQIFLVIISSVFIGFLNGFFGGGGGMICVPLLEKVLNLENKKAHATTIAVMAGLSIVSSIFYISKNSFDFNMIIYVVFGVVFGGAIGAILLAKLNGRVIRLIFAIIMLLAGLQMVVFL